MPEYLNPEDRLLSGIRIHTILFIS